MRMDYFEGFKSHVSIHNMPRCLLVASYSHLTNIVNTRVRFHNIRKGKGYYRLKLCAKTE